ncbi:MAG: hypothetical protein HY002_21650 [Candidatus Rokubacteria bacterium]|nr:hypothetical protein [Candidatus Rokubacteria bacterium]
MLAVIAFVRTGGIGDLRRQVDAVAATTAGARDKTADALDRLERLIRGGEKRQDEKAGGPGAPQSPSSPS